MEEYPMENCDNIWQWCRARKKRKIQSMADGFSKIGALVDGSSPNIIRKGRQCIDDSPISKSSTSFEGNALKSRAHLRNMCSSVQNSIAEVGPFKNGDSTKSSISVIQDHVPSSENNSDAMSDHQQCVSGLGGQLLPRTFGIWDEGIKISSGHTETSVDASSSCSIPKVVVEDMELQSRSVNGQLRDLRLVGGCETYYNYINWPCHPPARKKHKRNQSLVSDTCESPFGIENQKAKSDSVTLFPELHLLADVAVRPLENDVAGLHENSLTDEKGIRKAIYIPTGVPFFQKRVPRRAKSAFKYHQKRVPRRAKNAWPMVHDIQKNRSAAYSKPLLTVDNICRLGDPACIKKSENQVVGNGIAEDPMVIPHVRSSKRTRSLSLPSKYRDSVLQPWKIGTRR